MNQPIAQTQAGVPMEPGSSATSPPWRRALVVCSMAALLWSIAARVLGPSDMWDQRQPRTVSYTTDIIVNGGDHWILPVEQGEYPATKPPLYNWLAVPMVKVLGFSSDLAHKSPSVIALCLCWLAVVRLGRFLDAAQGQTVGWLAGLMLAANYTTFKLGYLARPDMLLTLWLLLGWLAATALLTSPPDVLRAPKARALRLAFWLCVALAGLTKGPPAIILPLYALLAARGLRGSWRAAAVFGWSWGLPLSLGLFGSWIWGVYRIDAQHLIDTLWFEEFFGRVTGLGSEGNVRGPVEFFRRILHMPLYYLSRFAPWSILSILAMVALWSRGAAGTDNRSRYWQEIGHGAGAWLHAAAILVVLIVALFTLSTGKRADYIAAAIPPGSLLAAWWLLRIPPRWGITAPWLAPATAVVFLASMTVYNQLESNAPQPGFGNAINRFAVQAEAQIRHDPRPMAFWATERTYLQSYLGYCGQDATEALRQLLEAADPFWLVAGERSEPPVTVHDWLRDQHLEATLTEVSRSDRYDGISYWPGQVVLYRVDPARQEQR